MKLSLLCFAIYHHILFLALIVSTVPRDKGSTTGLALSEDASRTEQHESTLVLSSTSQETGAPKRNFWRTVVDFLLPDAQARLEEYEARFYRRIEEARSSRTGRSGHLDIDRNETGD